MGADKVIGVYPKVVYDFEYAVKEYSFLEAIPAGIDKGINQIQTYLKQFKLFKNPEAFRSVVFYLYWEYIPRLLALAVILEFNGDVVAYSGRDEPVAYPGVGRGARDVPVVRGDYPP